MSLFHPTAPFPECVGKVSLVAYDLSVCIL